jgi:biofilm PGA synthesis N-glycosyltransferase PgaC
MPSFDTYVLMTPAKDEAEFVGPMLESVVRQTIRPLRHIVVDDGSRDETPRIVEDFARRYDFIALRSNQHTGKRAFGSKVLALNAAYDELKKLNYNFIGCLDADMTLPPEYYEGIMRKMRENPKLGIASGLCLNKSGNEFKRIMSNSQHVPGAFQFFRKECYEQIGGYQKVSVAGIDSLAEIKARMHGWETRAFEDLHGFHHKPIGSATAGPLKTSYKRGMTDYLLGKHPLYVMLKSVRRLRNRPYGVDAMAHLLGYFGPLFRRTPRDVDHRVLSYVRSEEMQTLKQAFLLKRKPF